MQVTLGLPEPSLPRLRLVQEGIKRTHAQRVVGKERICLPITPAISWVFQVGRDNSPIHPSSPSGMGGCICRQQSHANDVTNPPEADQLGRGVDVYVGRTGNSLCPVEAILAYIAVRGDSSGPFFKSGDQTPLTKAKFIARVRQALLALGLPYNNFAGHSFRIGAATTAAERR